MCLFLVCYRLSSLKSNAYSGKRKLYVLKKSIADKNRVLTLSTLSCNYEKLQYRIYHLPGFIILVNKCTKQTVPFHEAFESDHRRRAGA
jgi:hypothetical protein